MRPFNLRNSSPNPMRAALRGSVAFFHALLLGGCLSQGGAPVQQLQAAPSPSPDVPVVTAFTITNVTVTPDPKQDSTSLATIYLDARNEADLTSLCAEGDGTGDLGCTCRFSWDEGNNGVVVHRKLASSLVAVQRSALVCQVPIEYQTEIVNGTSVQIVVLAGRENKNAVKLPVATIKKEAGPQTGDFQDSVGNFFKNIHRYACFDRTLKGLEISSFVDSLDSSSINGRVPVAYANRFCFSLSTGKASNDKCLGLENLYSSQSYYYNFYTKSSDIGNLGSGNLRYGCPRVDPGLNGNSGRFWPLDTSFALATSPSAQFNIGVEAFVRPSRNEDQVLKTGDSCNPQSSDQKEGGSAISVLRGCLGFGSRPAANGSCGTYKDTSGNTRQLYRLRRFIAIFPPHFEANGTPIQQGQPQDTIYVLDRPGPLGQPIRGPKPCNFAYANLNPTSGGQNYLDTNNPGWVGRNVDGTAFPFGSADYLPYNPGNPLEISCPAFVPLWSRSNSGGGSFSRVQYSQVRTPIRPMIPWAPHFSEDTGFQVCAPLSPDLKDPPLHLSRSNDGDTRWCAEAYPTSNANNLPRGTRHHMDRAVVDLDLKPSYIPLQATDDGIQEMLLSDPSYGCFESWSGGEKPGSCCKEHTLIKGGSAHFETSSSVVCKPF